MKLFDQFLKVFKEFEKADVEYILIGGFAVILHGFPRLTQDIDILIQMTDSNIQKLQRALFRVFNDQEVFKITLRDLQDYAVVRYGSPEGFHLDFMTRIGEVANIRI